MATKVQVYQDPETSRWAARMVGDEERDPKFFDSREDAIRDGRRLAAERDLELVIHDETGEAEAKGRPAG
jgi:hypothetical protein